MKIALINEFSQAPKNAQIQSIMRQVAEPLGHTVVNAGMSQTDVASGNPADYPADNPCTTYVMTGIQASLLLNSGAVDFVVTGCGTGQGRKSIWIVFPFCKAGMRCTNNVNFVWQIYQNFSLLFGRVVLYSVLVRIMFLQDRGGSIYE